MLLLHTVLLFYVILRVISSSSLIHCSFSGCPEHFFPVQLTPVVCCCHCHELDVSKPGTVAPSNLQENISSPTSHRFVLISRALRDWRGSVWSPANTPPKDARQAHTTPLNNHEQHLPIRMHFLANHNTHSTPHHNKVEPLYNSKSSYNSRDSFVCLSIYSTMLPCTSTHCSHTVQVQYSTTYKLTHVNHCII